LAAGGFQTPDPARDVLLRAVMAKWLTLAKQPLIAARLRCGAGSIIDAFS
jgi:hypothetical protein